MQHLTQILTDLDNWLWGNWLLFVLLGIGGLYTVVTGFVQVRHFPYIIRKTLLDPLKKRQNDSAESGSISSFQALCTAVASCVGSGNIVGGLHSCSDRRSWRHLLDVDSRLCGDGYQIRRNHSWYALSGKGRNRSLRRRSHVLY